MSADKREPQDVQPVDPEAAAVEPPATAEDPCCRDAAALTAERDDLLARLQRVSADYLNYQKRAAREMAEAREFANAALLKDLLAVLDDMERGLAAAAANDALLAGMQLVCQKLLDVLRGYGVTVIDAEGQSFDPQRHEALMQDPSVRSETSKVVRQFQRGYELKGRVLRPARVVVSTPPEGNHQDVSGEGRPE